MSMARCLSWSGAGAIALAVVLFSSCSDDSPADPGGNIPPGNLPAAHCAHHLYATDAGVVDLSATVDPDGGTFSGANVSPAGMFDVSAAGVGDHMYTYTVTASDGSKGSCTGTVTVTPVDRGPPPPPTDAPDGWSYQNPYPTSGGVAGVAQLGVATAMTAGAFGVVLETTDGGASWLHRRAGQHADHPRYR